MIITTVDGFKIDLQKRNIVESSQCKYCNNDHEHYVQHDESIAQCVQCGTKVHKLGDEIIFNNLHINFWEQDYPVFTNTYETDK